MTSERDYEIRFHKADGSTALVFVTSCASDEHARETAARLMKQEFAGFEVRRGHACVAKGPQKQTIEQDASAAQIEA